MPDAVPPVSASARPSAPAPIVPAGRSPRAIGLFLLLTVVVLAADLGIKAWSFRTVAGTPVELTPLVAEDHFAFWSQYVHEPTVVVPKVLNLRLTTNTGAVFGLGKGNRVAFIGVSAVATAVIGFLFWRSPRNAWVLHGALALILAGALGNLYDRWQYAAVRDMFHMFPGVNLPFGLSWPAPSAPAGHPPIQGPTEIWPWIFNLADVALMVGVGLVLVTSLFTKDPNEKAEECASSSKRWPNPRKRREVPRA